MRTSPIPITHCSSIGSIQLQTEQFSRILETEPTSS